MSVTYKDIDLLSQKSSVAGTEKLPVSDTEYISPDQIVEPIKRDVNRLVKSFALTDSVFSTARYITNNNVWSGSNSPYCHFFSITPGKKYIVSYGIDTYVAVLKDTSHTVGDTPNWATGFSSKVLVAANTEYEFVAPVDGLYLYALASYNGEFRQFKYLTEVSGELVSNKVTALSSSSTDTQYPSAKCVYDGLNGKQSTIDSSHKLDYSLLDNTPTIPTKVSDLNNDSGFIATETDPVFTASAAYDISSSDITNWNAKQKAITVSSSEPTSADGSDGDIWIVI